MSDFEKRFLSLISHGREHTDLHDMMLLLAKLEQPTLNVEACELRLDSLMLQAQARMRQCNDGIGRSVQLCRFIAHEQGFSGNELDYYNPLNSNIDHVLRSGIGIPISLAFVYIQAARSMGWLAHGVAFPSHFLVAVFDEAPGGLQGGALPERYTLIDPFRGVTMSKNDCLLLLQSRYGASATLQDRFFYPADNAAYMSRMLTNLKQCYVRAEDHANALRLVNILLSISPSNVAELHDRAAILEHMQCYSAAAADLQAISNERPDHPRLAEIKHSIIRLENLSTPTLH